MTIIISIKSQLTNLKSFTKTVPLGYMYTVFILKKHQF